MVCIASSNGGTTSQDLKTGFLVGATPSKQQWGIVVGAVTSALVIGVTMLALNAAGTHYTTQGLPAVKLTVPADAPRERAGRPHEADPDEYAVVHVRKGDVPGAKPGRYLVAADGTPKYLARVPIGRKDELMDDGTPAPKAFTAPQPELFYSLIEGILGGKLEWGLVVLGALIAVALELAGVAALPVAVGMYIPLAATTPIFLGGLVRWLADRVRGAGRSDAETETSPGVLLASGFIAGGTLCGLIVAFFEFVPALKGWVDVGGLLFGEAKDGEVVWDANAVAWAKGVAVAVFAGLAALLLAVGSEAFGRKNRGG